MNQLDIIILSYAKNDYLRRLTCQSIETLIASENPEDIQFNIVVIESAETPKYDYENCSTIFPKTPFGYNKYMNIGLKLTNSPYVCLCNNDLIFHKSWASNILKAMEENPLMKSASPLCEKNHVPRGFLPNTGVKLGYEVRNEISGWCLFFKREILSSIGYLEEGLKFWYSDNDYALTLQKNQIQHGLVTNSLVDHLESQSLNTKSEFEKTLLTSDERFFMEYKWGNRSYLSYLNCKRKIIQKTLWKSL